MRRGGDGEEGRRGLEEVSLLYCWIGVGSVSGLVDLISL